MKIIDQKEGEKIYLINRYIIRLPIFIRIISFITYFFKKKVVLGYHYFLVSNPDSD